MRGNNTDIPRPEYPRPDFQRGTSEGIDWICLNGTWEFAFDPDDIGEQNQWYSSESTDDSPWTLQIQVPYPWESLAAWGNEEQADNTNYLSKDAYLNPEEVTCGGLDREGNYRGEPRQTIGWYRKVVSFPENWGDKRVILNFGAVDWEATVWVNGNPIGKHENGYLPFEFDITDVLTPGESTVIVVRAYDAQDHGEQLAGKQIGWYVRTSGIWQTVYLEPRSETHIAQCHITPDINNASATFAVKTDGDVENTELTLRWHCDGLSGSKQVSSHETQFIVNISPEQLRLWDVDTPNLYDVTLELVAEGRVVDRIFTYFGMRKVSIAKAPGGDYQYIYLNNRPIYLLGALNQSFNPEGVYTFLTDEAIRRDVERAKEFGFNFLRLHIKVDEPRLYYWADKLGLLFMCDIPNFGTYTEKAKARFEQTLRGNIARDYNHPSIISWCNFNETWGLGGNEYKEMTDRQEWVREMYHLAKSLDTTRLIEDNSPCLYDHVETDINSWHFYINDYDRAKEHIANVVAETYPGSAFNYAGGNVQSDAPLINSEYGGISAGAGDKDISWCFKYLTNELRLHPKICGYIYTELQDIEWEHNGFMNYDRSVKEFGYDYQDINTLDFIAIDYPPGTTVAPGDEIKADIYASHFSHKTITGTTLHWQLDTISATGHVTRGNVSGNVEIPFPQYQVQHVHQLELRIPDVHPAVGTLHVWVTDHSGTVVARNFINFEHFVASTASVGSNGSGLISLNYAPISVSESSWNEPTTSEQLFSAIGSGSVEYEVSLPERLSAANVAEIALIFEASSCYGGARQTEPEKYPSDVTLSVNGVEIDTIRIPDCPADARGALSYIHGEPGIYGYLHNVKVDPSLILNGKADTLTIRYEVKADAEAKGGFALYGARMGRYPTGPHLLIRQK
ncbi:glycoside hydrolase family 2 [Candidatus Poribacteria bacterium]|nr:glycoside hydrolase family 2 [Candidatus Poribacteria bacterium]MYH83220.1 glycoside hydrolase family 2 [Candidatus Poribacteria bacterium]MYK92610.1 glycoside hydrolase family 2 [Candidatus Poribacteria bacterium]